MNRLDANDPPDTRQRILQAAAALAREGGPGGLTFDAVARRLGLSKQAVLYWFPSRADLLASLVLPALRDEAAAAIEAARSATSPAAAAGAVVGAVIRFHMADLDRFRLMYLAPQAGMRRNARSGSRILTEEVHPLTSEMYGAIAKALGGSECEAREGAVALHMAALGHVLMVAMTEAIGDPLRHDPQRLSDRLARMLSVGLRGKQE
jgi:AcrR family transcriptional regulator